MPRKDQIASLQELRSLFFAIRCLMRERIPGSSRDPHTWLRMETLRFIDQHPGCSLGELAQYLRVAPPSASSLVQALLRAGHLRRGAGSDRRSVKLSVTAQGKKELQKSEIISMQAMQDVFGALSSTDIQTLRSILEAVVSHSTHEHEL